MRERESLWIIFVEMSTFAAGARVGPMRATPLSVREKRSINQKWITQIFHLVDPEALLKPLKKKLGAGGTISDGVLEIQGKMKDRICKELENQGFKVRQG